jgi:hypothetical protein
MRINRLSLGVLIAFIMGMYLFMPAVHASSLKYDIPDSSPCGWATFTSFIINDSRDDVVQYSISSSPEKGTVGAFHPEIDVANITLEEHLAEDSLFIRFEADITVNASYSFVVLIDNTSDNVPDFTIFSNDTGLFLKSTTENLWWDGGTWVDYETETSWVAYENWLYLDMLLYAIPNIAIANIAVIATYLGDPSYIYADYVPLTPEKSPIPGFPWQLAIFSLLTLMGLVILLQKNRYQL